MALCVAYSQDKTSHNKIKTNERKRMIMTVYLKNAGRKISS